MTVIIGMIRLAVLLAALGCGAVAIAAWFGFLVPFFDLFNHFQALLIPCLLGLLALVLVAFWGSRWQLPLAGFVLLGLLASAVTVVPETIAAFAPRPPLPTDGRTVLKLMTHNLFGLNYDMTGVSTLIAAEQPDIVALQEYFPEQRSGLPPLIGKDYPYSVYCVGGKRANLAIFSKLPFEQVKDGDCTTDAANSVRTAHILAHFTLPDGTQFSVLTTHFEWPYPFNQLRRQQQKISAVVAGDPGPLLLVGDFNSAPWSYSQRQFAAGAGLTRQTHGILTWPMRFDAPGSDDRLPVLPLDQVMSRGAITVYDVHAGPPTGSDHLPLIVTFAVDR